MSDSTALLPAAREQAEDTFAQTAGARFDDAVADRAGDTGTRRPSRALAVLRRPTVVVAAVWLVIVAVAAIAPSLLAPGDPLLGVPADKLLPPSAEHLFGTDQIGRDLYTRTVHGASLTLSAAAIAVGIGMLVGAVLGLVAGFTGGRVDDLIMRFADVLLAIPGLLLSLAIITVLGFGTVNVAIAVGAASVASVSRIMRSEVLRVRSSPFVEAAYTSGNRWLRVLLRHVLPNAIGPVLVLAVLELGGAILAVSSLSFLGYGAQPPLAEWGSLVSGGRDHLRSAWWLTTFPGIAIALTVLSAHRLSRALDTDRSDR
ncbi:ABC transporter permease [Microbacterium sp. No. 7]|uniref:ABC transporter permease n=1 Tax=Microbacterium sp. No. 7 TaxID=1714373 RepID=UPI0006D0A00F|nr:ABC transporter permease [Microbacterium sp. No. 7]ALJ18658.1 peptide ABC transporter permease [Microbacterium sp. No. 7]